MELEDLEKAVGKGVDLSRGDFHGQSFNCGSLDRGRFAQCDFRGCSLQEVSLLRADMREADLTGASLVGASLDGTDLTGAILRNANLEGAFLERTNLERTVGLADAGFDWRGYRFVGVWFTDPGCWIIKAGCRWFTEQQAVAHWTSRGNVDALERVRVICSSQNR
jgi:uncharacterized protein YjbI with pentapeptide repeats